MQKNVGTLDAFMRISWGLAGLAWSAAKMARHSGRTSAMIVAILSGMKVAEGVIRFCPMLYAMGISTKETPLKAE